MLSIAAGTGRLKFQEGVTFNIEYETSGKEPQRKVHTDDDLIMHAGTEWDGTEGSALKRESERQGARIWR